MYLCVEAILSWVHYFYVIWNIQMYVVTPV